MKGNIFKRIISAVMVLAVLSSMFVLSSQKSKAAVLSGTCGDNLAWEIDDEGTLTITGTGDMYTYSSNLINGEYYTTAPWGSSNSIKRVVISEGITKIGGHSFFRCENLTSATIAKSVSKIEISAFYRCSKYKNTYYYGSEEEWGEITVGLYNDILTKNISYDYCNISGHNYIEIVTPPTCTERGYTTYVCTHCEDTYIDNYTEPKHELNRTEISATCTENGMYYVECSKCGELIDSGIINAVGHTVIIDCEAKEPTCTEVGNTEGSHCSVCGEVLSVSSAIDPLGHEVSREERSATCTKSGMYIEKCLRCAKTLDAGTIPALGHDLPVNYTFTVQPTATEDGERIKTCGRCGEVAVRETVHYRAGDSDGDGAISAKDIAMLKNLLVNYDYSKNVSLASADVNGDGVYTAGDVEALKHLLAQ